LLVVPVNGLALQDILKMVLVIWRHIWYRSFIKRS